MGGLFKKEVVIRPTSTVTVQGAKDFASNWLNTTFQDVESNKDADGNYIDYFFGDIFDARDGNIYRIFSDACSTKYDMDTLEFEVLNTSNFATNENTTTNLEKIEALETKVESVDLTGISTTIDSNTNRIKALELTDSEVQAIVL